MCLISDKNDIETSIAYHRGLRTTCANELLQMHPTINEISSAELEFLVADPVETAPLSVAEQPNRLHTNKDVNKQSQ